MSFLNRFGAFRRKLRIASARLVKDIPIRTATRTHIVIAFVYFFVGWNVLGYYLTSFANPIIDPTTGESIRGIKGDTEVTWDVFKGTVEKKDVPPEDRNLIQKYQDGMLVEVDADE